MAEELVDFEDIVTAVRGEIGIQEGDTTNVTRIKQHINMIYLNEVVPYRRWWWLEGNTNVIHKAPYDTGTATATADSVTVTLTDAPSVGLGSFLGYQFRDIGFDETYIVAAHTAGSTTVTLSSPYQGTTGSSKSFKIWQPMISLPTDCRETVDVWHDRFRQPMKGQGRQQMREIELSNPLYSTWPLYYAPGDFYDPTPGDEETETDRIRQLRVYPSITPTNVTLHINYTKEVTALDLDGDEPLMPIEDRIIILYGALSRAWVSVARNPEAADANRQLFQNKLSQMASKNQDGNDNPRIAPQSNYLLAARRPIRQSRRWWWW